MNPRRVVRSSLLAAVVVALSLEALAWARAGTVDLVRASFPHAATFADGSAGFVRWSGDAAVPRAFGRDRAPLELSAEGAARLRFVDRWAAARRRDGPDRTFDTPAFTRAPRAFPSGVQRLLWLLSTLRAFDPAADPLHASGRATTAGAGRWSFEDGLLVWRPSGEATPAIRIGPGGRVADGATPGDRFGALQALRGDGVEASFGLADDGVPPSAGVWRRYDPRGDRLVEGTLRRTPAPPFVEVSCRSIPLVAPASAAPVLVAPWWPVEPGRADPPIGRPAIVASSDRLRVVDAIGQVWFDVVRGADETAFDGRDLFPRRVGEISMEAGIHRFHATTGLATGDPLAVGIRIRHGEVGKALATDDLVWSPTSAGERALEGLACVPLALRPLPLAVASFLSAAPSDGRSGTDWWWRDPVVAGGRRPGAMAAALAVAALCGWIGWRRGRVHGATVATARAWALVAALLGPVGLLLLRLLGVRACDDAIAGPSGPARRSLALEASPASSTPWPAPPRTGREIVVAP